MSVEHKAELQAIVQSLNNKHQQELQESEEGRVNMKLKLEKELMSKVEDRLQLLNQFDKEKDVLKVKFQDELSKTEVEKSHELSKMEAENDELREEIRQIGRAHV